MSNLSKFLPTAEMQAEFEQYKQLTTEQERAQFQEQRAQRIESLSQSEQTAYVDASMQGLNQAVKTAEEIIIAHRLGGLEKAISLSYIAKTYFGKSKEWLYQRVNGYKVNGKPAQFTNEEKITFVNALQDLSRQLQETSVRLV